MERYLIDTNVVSDYFSASLTDTGLHFMDSVIDAVPNLSVITQIELLCWKTNAHKEQTVSKALYPIAVAKAISLTAPIYSIGLLLLYSAFLWYISLSTTCSE